MGDKAEQIARHIDDQRDELRDNIAELRQRATASLDWRAQVHERPATMAALAFGGGVLLAMLLPGRESSYNPGPDAAPAGTPRVNPLAAQFNQLKGAMFAITAAKLGSSLESILPGFQREYQRAGVTVEH